MNILLLLMMVLQAPAQPEPLEGPITEALEKLVTRFHEEEKQEMEGILSRLRERNELNAQEFGKLRDLFKERETNESVRYQGLRSLLQEIRDREQPDNSALFPRFAELRNDLKVIKEAQEMGTGPIREALQMLTNLVYGLILLAGVLLAVDMYRTFFRTR